jgi:hypothetical protein
MWDPQHLTTLWAFTACYGNTITLILTTGYEAEWVEMRSGRYIDNEMFCPNQESGLIH